MASSRRAPAGDELMPAAGKGRRVRPHSPGRTHRVFMALLLVALPIALVLAIGVGATKIPPMEVISIIGVGLRRLFGAAPQPVPGLPADPAETIILLLRLPRALLAALCGAALALAGATFQAVFRNPLADPYILGASSGAALGAASAILLGLPATSLARLSLPAAAFAGGMLAVALAYTLARRAGGASTLGLLLAGVVVGAWLSAMLSLMIYFSGRFLAQITFWLMGGFGGTTWRSLFIVSPYLALGGLILAMRVKELNALTLGDDTAMGLGVDAERSRRLLVAGATLLTAAAVAVSGPIGFVGLMVPHLVRIIIGGDHWRLLPASALAGALLMVLADMVARTVLAPSELPVGIITSLLGGPFFLWLLTRRGHASWFGGRT